MTNNQILELLPKIEVQICGILIENGICEYIRKPKNNSHKNIHNCFENLKLTSTFVGHTLVKDEDIQKLRNLYPERSSRRGEKNVIKEKATRWLTENSKYTFKDILYVVEQYVFNEMNNSGGDMLFNLNNIFYKLEQNRYSTSPMSRLFDTYFNEKRNNNINTFTIDV